MAGINRLWLIRGSDLESRLEILYKRPRIDYRVSEYVFDYIVEKLSVLKGDWSIDLSFIFLFNKDEEINYCRGSMSIYNTENTKYDFDRSTEKAGGAYYTTLHLFCYSTELNENITPKEYANIVYDMIGAYLVNITFSGKREKITKELMEKLKSEMDYDYINQFKFPALFDDQKYYDDNKSPNFLGIFNPECDGLNIKEDYIKHYGE